MDLRDVTFNPGADGGPSPALVKAVKKQVYSEAGLNPLTSELSFVILVTIESRLVLKGMQ